MNLLRQLYGLSLRHSEKDKRLISSIKSIIGSKPFNLSIYKLAFQHSSVAKEEVKGIKLSNERLEYLGDAVLGMVIAEFLFQKFPYRDEGFLTDIRARIVNRESLNKLARKIGIGDLINYDENKKNSLSYKSLYGDALEAFIGAIYLDKGYASSKKFILKKLISPHIDLREVVMTDPNFKSKVIEWAQKSNKEVSFEIIELKSGRNQLREFTAQLLIDKEPICTGTGFNKKKRQNKMLRKNRVKSLKYLLILTSKVYF